LPAPDADADTLALLEAAVRAGGRIARDLFESGTFKKWDKGKGDPVTEADLAVDTYLRETLRAARPDYGWLSEETKDDPERLSKPSVFVVDPIDGTIAFIKHRPHFTICAGVVTGGVPVAGAVYNPMTEECFTARAGHGAYLNGTRIHVSDRDALEGCRMLGDKGMLQHGAWNTPPNRPWPPMQVETRNSIAYRMALVACGAFDAMMALSPKRDWDLAAAEIILTEAGGIATTHIGARFAYNRESTIQPSLIAAGPKLHAELLARVSHITLPRR
jgi:myo-inositol-1(or 4)-monophosphatase